jgi:hypothetical protein
VRFFSKTPIHLISKSRFLVFSLTKMSNLDLGVDQCLPSMPPRPPVAPMCGAVVYLHRSPFFVRFANGHDRHTATQRIFRVAAPAANKSFLFMVQVDETGEPIVDLNKYVALQMRRSVATILGPRRPIEVASDGDM